MAPPSVARVLPAALAALVLGAAVASAQGSNPKAGSAVVIGAGMSGLTAAEALCAKGFSVSIIEGRQRIGGRTFTTKFAGSGKPIEVGAGWM